MCLCLRPGSDSCGSSPRSQVDSLYGHSVFNFLRSSETFSRAAALVFPTAVNEGSGFLPRQFLFLIIAILMGMKCLGTCFICYIYGGKFFAISLFYLLSHFYGSHKKFKIKKNHCMQAFLMFLILPFASGVKRAALVYKWNKYFILFYFFHDVKK